VPARQSLVVLLDAHVARATPHTHGRKLETVPEHGTLTGVRTVLPVIGHARGGWVRVLLPGRPNAHKGWIRSYRTRPSSTPWQLRVDLSARRVTVYRDGIVQRRFRAVIGAPATPTPRLHPADDRRHHLAGGAHRPRRSGHRHGLITPVL
jgi:hypothetical protein